MIRGVIRFRFGHEDLVRLRFAISPLFDLMWSTDVLRDPAAHSLHLPWARAARERLDGLDWRCSTARHGVEHGTFPTSSPRRRPRRWPTSTPSSRACARRARAGRARAARRLGVAGRRRPRGCCSTIPQPASSAHRGDGALLGARLAPWWPGIRAALEDDIIHRARRVTAGGAIEVFADLHPSVRWRDGVLEVDHRRELRRSTCAGAGCCSSPPPSPGRGCSP